MVLELSFTTRRHDDQLRTNRNKSNNDNVNNDDVTIISKYNNDKRKKGTENPE